MTKRGADPVLRSVAIVAVGLALAGCSTAGGSSGEQEVGEGTHGSESVSVPDSRPHITGIVTEVKRAPRGEVPSSTRILVEEDPENCSKSQLSEGCDRLYLDVTESTRVFRKVGDGEEVFARASTADLEKGQRVRAWHTGRLKKSYPGQGSARTIVIDATDALSERTANYSG